MKNKRSQAMLLIMISFILLASCSNHPSKATETSTCLNIQSSITSSVPQTFNFLQVKAEPGFDKSKIRGSNYYNRETMVTDGSRLYFIMPDYGQTIVSCGLSGNNAMKIADCLDMITESGITGGGRLWQLKIDDGSLYVVMMNEGLFRIPLSGGDAVRLIKGDIQDYIEKDNLIYYADFYSDTTADYGYYVLKCYDTDNNQITEIDRLSVGAELLKLGGYIVGFQDNELFYTQRDENKKRSYFSCSSDGRITPISYKKGQEIETEMAKKNIRPLNDESSEVNHVDGKSLIIDYKSPGPNLLYLNDRDNKQLIAKVNGEYVYLFGNDIYVLDRQSNIELIVFE